MSNIAKLKEKARNLEAKSPDKAIEVYVQIIEELDGTPELDAEMGLFNKVGDLYQKTGKTPEAADIWERAMNRYAEGGFANNAIALCNKILRVAPARTPVYLRLAQLMVQRGLVSEAKQHFLEYADRMQKAGKLNEAFKALKEFADLSPNNSEIRLMLAEQLKAAARTDEAREQLAMLYAEAQASGDARRSRATLTQIQAIDPGYNVEQDPKAKAAPKSQKSSDLVFLDLGDAAPAPPKPAPKPVVKPAAAAPAPAPPKAAPPPPPPPPPPKAAPPPKAPPAPLAPPKAPAAPKRPSTAVPARPSRAVPEAPRPAPPPPPVEEEPVVEADLGIERSSVQFEGPPEPVPVEGLDSGLDLGTISLEPVAEASPAEELPTLDVPDVPVVPDMPADVGAGLGADDVMALEVPEIDLGGSVDLGGDLTLDTGGDLMIADAGLEPVGAPAGPPDLATLEAAVADDPDDPARHQALGEALIEQGERERGIQELDLAMSAWETREEWQTAHDRADEIIRLDPNSIRHHQKRVEYAYRLGDKPNLVNAYLELGDAFFRSGAMDRARTVYQRVLEHDASNQRARAALQTMEPAPAPTPAAPPPPSKKPAPAAAGSGDFVDLGSFILDDDDGMKDTRMRIQDEEPTGDEERDFQDMLSQFKKGIEQTVSPEDAQTHYDLGVAFKEMGLLDEAIGEFQKALQGKDMRIRSSEALGLCFFEKGQPGIAATVLRRAIDQDTGSDEQKIGLLYWLGRSLEEEEKRSEALAYYQRVFAIDIRFQDVNDRVKSLAKAGR